MVRYLNHDLFCTWPPRPFVELAATEHARRKGVLTVEVVAACIERTWGPFYRGWLITRELAGATDLWGALQDEHYTKPDKRPLLKAVAESIRRMHDQGIYHSDLNLKNVLVRRKDVAIEAYIIDFDKAQLFSGSLSSTRVEKNFKRLDRSLRKLDPDQSWITGDEWQWLRTFYFQARLCEA
jgi:tRNA A-37 threonylcarbamoyl transferase component Bud32